MDAQIIGAIKIKDGLFIGDQYSAEVGKFHSVEERENINNKYSEKSKICL